jgi:hypothetical protein
VGTDSSAVDEASGIAAVDNGTAAAGGTASSDVQNVETTAADAGSAAPTQEQLVGISVCQVDQARAAELGIDAMATAGPDSSATE